MLLTVFEHQTLRQTDFVKAFGTTTDFDWLLAQIQSHQLPCFSIGYSSQVVITVRHYLAVIRLPSGNIIEILPKISHNDSKENAEHQVETRQWVAQMLADIFDFKRQKMMGVAVYQHNRDDQNDPSEQEPKTWLYPLVNEWFTLLSSLPTLLPRHYQHTQQNNPQAQGKLLIKKQISHNAHRPHYRYTSHQKFDLHPLWAQFFYTALAKISTLGVPVIPTIKQAVENIAVNKLNARQVLPVSQHQAAYCQLKSMLASGNTQKEGSRVQQLTLAVELAWFFLQIENNIQQVTHPVLGNKIAPAVMINMQQAFERWVSIKLVNQNIGEVKTQARFTWLQQVNNDCDANSSTTRYLQPDALVFDGPIKNNTKENGNNRAIAVVADIKYKHIDGCTQINTADLYQLYTYQQFLKSKQAWLIYPVSENFKKSEQLVFQQYTHSPKKPLKIKVIPFDVFTGEFLF